MSLAWQTANYLENYNDVVVGKQILRKWLKVAVKT
jgi:hypothetical protein